MSRDYTKLRVFKLADELILEIYQEALRYPPEEQFGLRTQLQRAAVSSASNIVEGSVRRSERHWVNYLETASGSACETRYLIDLSGRLKFFDPKSVDRLCSRYSELVAGLQALISSMPAGNVSHDN